MKRFHPNTWRAWAAFGLLIGLLTLWTSEAKAQTQFWDINGTTTGAGGTSPSGNWEDANWSTNSSATTDTGTVATTNFVEGVFPRFAAGTDATGSYTVTANADHTIAGMLHQTATGTVTITGPGVLTIALGSGNGQQGFFGGSGGFILIQSKLTGPGGVVSQSGQIYLDGDNDYSAGTTPGAGLINFNNPHSFGTGNFTLSICGGALIAEGTAPITIANNWTVSLATVNLNCVGNTGGITYSGNVDLGANFFNVGSGGSTANINIFSGVISGTGGFGRQAQTTAGIVKITGANTYTGKTVLNAGTTWVSSLNRVVGGTASSNLGAPTTVANGTIALGGISGTLPGTPVPGILVYTGAGETTDRVIDLASTTAGGTIQNDGSGPLVFTSDFTATGVGVKTLTLRGSNTGNNTIAGAIVNGASATSVAKSDAGTWTLSGTNTYSGGTTLNAGRLNLANISALGSGNLVIGGNGSFDNTSGGDLSIANGLTCNGGSPTYVGSANLTMSGPALITGANRTITVSGSILTLGAGLGDNSEGRNLTKAGAGTLVLGGVSSYTGTTTVSAGTLQFGATNAIISSSLILNGGNLNPAGFNQNLIFTTLGLTASSSIDFGPGGVEVDFINSSASTWTGSILNLVNWDPFADFLRFGTDATGLSPAQLAKIEFNGAGLGSAQIDAQGYIFAVPEPSAVALGWIGGGG